MRQLRLALAPKAPAATAPNTSAAAAVAPTKPQTPERYVTIVFQSTEKRDARTGDFFGWAWSIDSNRASDIANLRARCTDWGASVQVISITEDHDHGKTKSRSARS